MSQAIINEINKSNFIVPTSSIPFEIPNMFRLYLNIIY